MKNKFTVSFADSMNLHKRPDAELLLIAKGKSSGMNFDVSIIKFASRKALEAFNVKAGLRPVIYTQVPRNMVTLAHESDSDARQQSLNEYYNNEQPFKIA
ncbi:MAG: hypothetical protein EBZ49_03700 [Proteobacteria bacterium]|nr:hypothetical protein [Pseudomonadota bacterium]